ncbi:hypothetical protein QJS04_geneDACA000955 [Acorus gramineus]|uniref:Uncharacterized protein n=1 Tax=Acorus gramineus TaxID=55184 RepID=A0AAV9AF43_ACOGR|nr:hypothetical protein QJS04_geneDACA000955 [Acorus gramineus]
MGLEMGEMAAAIGVSVPVLRFLLCFLATIPVSFAGRFVPGRIPRHVYSAATGAVLSYLSFGASSNLHFIVPMSIGYLFMIAFRRHCGLLTFLAAFGYLIGCHFAGPVYEMKDYLDWTEEKGLWSRSGVPSPSPYGATLRAIVQAGICMGIYLYLVALYPLSRFNEPIYQEWGFWHRLWYQYMSGFTARWKYYFIWSISESSIIISGLGFSGWSGSPPKAQWDRAKNVDILGVELATSSVQLPAVWNIQVSTWLRYYVYERLITKGKKPGFLQLLATQTVSAVWHGLYPGYMIFFIQSALMIAGSRVIYRWQQGIPEKLGLFKNLLSLMNFFYTILVLNYSCIGFQVLSLNETLGSYKSVYYVGTIIPVVLILLSYIIKPARPSKPKARKEQ